MVVGAVFDRVPAVVERVQREVVLARFIGKLAVDQGVRELRGRVETLIQPPDSTAETPAPDCESEAADPATAEAPADAAAEAPATASPADVEPDVAVDELALDDYDELPAAHIVAKLAVLDADEREQIARYERGHRNRRTVLNQVARLAEASA